MKCAEELDLEAACDWKDLGLEVPSTKCAMAMKINWHDMLECVWYVHLFCKNVGSSMGR
jgi:hypothetical protein